MERKWLTDRLRQISAQIPLILSEELKERISTANKKLGELKSNENELKAKIAAANGELKNQIANMDENAETLTNFV